MWQILTVALMFTYARFVTSVIDHNTKCEFGELAVYFAI